MVHTDTKAVTICRCGVGSLAAVDEVASVLHVCSLVGLLFDEFVRTIVEIVAGKVHLSVKEIECTVETAHP